MAPANRRGRIKLFMTLRLRSFPPFFLPPHSWLWSDGISIIADGSSPRRPPPGAPFDDFGAADVHAGHRLQQQQQQLHPHPHHPRQQSPRCRAQQAAAAAAASASNFCTMRRTGASGVLHSGGGRRAVQFADQPIMQQTRKSSVSINKFVDVQCLMDGPLFIVDADFRRRTPWCSRPVAHSALGFPRRRRCRAAQPRAAEERGREPGLHVCHAAARTAEVGAGHDARRELNRPDGGGALSRVSHPFRVSPCITTWWIKWS